MPPWWYGAAEQPAPAGGIRPCPARLADSQDARDASDARRAALCRMGPS